jgi:hypothetical protein
MTASCQGWRLPGAASAGWPQPGAASARGGLSQGRPLLGAASASGGLSQGRPLLGAASRMGSRMGSNGGVDDRSCLPPACLLPASSACLLPASSVCLLCLPPPCLLCLPPACRSWRVLLVPARQADRRPEDALRLRGRFRGGAEGKCQHLQLEPDATLPSPPLGATFPLAALFTLLMRVVSLYRAGSPCCDDVRDEGEAEH